LEARTPFLDHHLTEYVNNLPPSAKLRWDEKEKVFLEKWVLREASKPFITKELYERKKHPYSAPTSYPQGGPMHKLLEGIITKENIEDLGFLDWDQCKDLVQKAFVKDSALAMRYSMVVSQWITIGKRFGVKRAERPMNM